MTSAALGTLTAALLAVGFAMVGEALLQRASRDLLAWNESFLIGLGASAAALFPLSLILPRSALDVELGLMVLCALIFAWRRLHRGSRPDPPRFSGELKAIARDGVALAFLAPIAFLALFFGALNLWYGHSWDSVQVYATRVELLLAHGGLSRHWFPEDIYDARLLAYPPLIPLFEALLCRVRGAFDFDSLKHVFLPFYVSLLLSTYAAARTLCSRRWALATVLLMALLPELTTGPAAGGYVDMPLAAFVAAIVAASLRTDREETGWRSPVAWLIGALTTAKQEGMILAMTACGGILLFWIAERPRRLSARLRSAGSGVVVILAFVAARLAYVRWLGVHDTTWGPFDAAHLSRAWKNLGLVVSLCLHHMLEPRKWGLFWPAFLVASMLIAAYGLARPTCLAIATGATILVYAAIFLFTNWSIELHITGAYSRLLAQLAPAAAVVIGAAGNRIWSHE
jgi:hypothetical protein